MSNNTESGARSMSMTTELAQRMKAAALNATPGRLGDRIDGTGSIKYQCFGNDGSLVLQTDHKNMEYGFIGPNSTADELLFRECSPENMLALVEALEARDKQIAELGASHNNLREALAGIHNTITGGGAYTPLAAILNASKRAYEESEAAAGKMKNHRL